MRFFYILFVLFIISLLFFNYLPIAFVIIAILVMLYLIDEHEKDTSTGSTRRRRKQ